MTQRPESSENESSFYVGFQIGQGNYGFHLRSRSTKMAAWSLFGVIVLMIVAVIVWQFQPLLRELVLR